MGIIREKYCGMIPSASLVFLLLYTTTVHQYPVLATYNSSETTGIVAGDHMHQGAIKNQTVHSKTGSIPPTCSDVPCGSCGGTPHCSCKTCHPCRADLIYTDGNPEHAIWNCLCSDGVDYPPHNCP